jgi:hypothetical protein
MVSVSPCVSKSFHSDRPCQQINQVKAWLDGSLVYGSDQAAADSLRTFVGGKLWTIGDDLPPTGASGNPLAGDVRTNENFELSSMLALFVREHNWWADRVRQEIAQLSDQQVYEQARAIVIAEIQAITYNELLPSGSRESALDRYNGDGQPEFDNQIVDNLRSFLFGQSGQEADLASLDIERGCDHGLADYNSVREAYGLSAVDSVDDVSSDPAILQAIQDLYGDVEDIDLCVGALAEDHVRKSSIGLFIRTIVADRFKRLRDGDGLLLEGVFSTRDVDRIQRTTLADVIERNTSVHNVQDNVDNMQAEAGGTVFGADFGLTPDADGRPDRSQPFEES